MRSIRPIFGRHNTQKAERLKNRDWIEFLQVVHPAQAEKAEREYLLNCLSADWASLTTPILATHTLPVDWTFKKLLVACDHNAFASELMLLAPVVEKKISSSYGFSLQIQCKTVPRIDWKKPSTPVENTPVLTKKEAKKHENAAVLEELIARLTKG
ncbi:MAG: hypothetical protein LDLANPLL_00292 [Turneriella sp.]|nr:hypothetical protein [Turneriella sp.]